MLAKHFKAEAMPDKFIWNEFEQLRETKLPQSGEVHGHTS